MSLFKRNKPTDLNTDAAALHAQGLFTALETLTRNAIAQDPNNADAWFWLGLALADLDRNAEALAAFQQARVIDPDLDAASLNAAQILLSEERFEEADALLRPLPRAESGVDYVLTLRIRALAAMGRSEEAETLARAAAGVQPSEDEKEHWAGELNDVGIELAKAGLPDAALSLLRVAADLEPDAPTYVNIGIVYTDTDRPLEALFAFLKAAELSPEHPRIYYNLARVLASLDPAIAACRKTLDLDPDYPDIRGNFAKLLYQAGRADEAEEQFRQAVAHYGTAYARAELAGFLSDEDRDDEAETEALAALDMDSSDTLALRVVGDCHAVRGDFARARSYYEDAARKAPDWWLPRWYMARIDALQHDRAALLDSLEAALQVDYQETIQAFQHDDMMEPYREDISVRALLQTAGLMGADSGNGE